MKIQMDTEMCFGKGGVVRICARSLHFSLLLNDEDAPPTHPQTPHPQFFLHLN